MEWKEKVIQEGSDFMKKKKKEGFTTMETENPQMHTSLQNKSFSLTEKFVTGFIAIALICLAPIIPILIAFGVGHFSRWNADKLRQRRYYERHNSEGR